MNFQKDCIGSESENAYTDILDGEVAKDHLHGMDNNYKAWHNENIADRVNTVPVNLLLMNFYDGAQLFHWRTCEFWCFLTTIVNLSRAYRGKLGISTFLSAIYAGKHRTAERCLFTDLYCEELRALYEGFEYIGMTDQRFFIQARLIFMLWIRRHSNLFSIWNSLQPPAMDVHFNYLRYFVGQSGRCCPHGCYESEGKYFNREVFINDDEPITASSLTKKNDMDFCMPCGS